MPKENAKKTKSAPKTDRVRFGLLILVALFLVTFLTYFAWRNNRYSELQFGNKTIAVEEVKSLRDKEKGLGGRESLADDRGMLFAYDKAGKYCFWMKGMKFPIDILWLDESKKVVHVAAHVPPESFPDSFCPPEDAQYILEVKAGLSGRSGVDVGSQL